VLLGGRPAGVLLVRLLVDALGAGQRRIAVAATVDLRGPNGKLNFHCGYGQVDDALAPHYRNNAEIFIPKAKVQARTVYEVAVCA
jgi:hypothetical protein